MLLGKGGGKLLLRVRKLFLLQATQIRKSLSHFLLFAFRLGEFSYMTSNQFSDEEKIS